MGVHDEISACRYEINRRLLLAFLALISLCLLPFYTLAQPSTNGDPLPSWNDGARKAGDRGFRQGHDRPSSPNFVPPEARIATFDQDGTLWVEHPIYSQVVYCLDRVPALVKAKPELANVEPFKTVLSGDREAMAKLSTHDLEKILFATLTGMTVDVFERGSQEMDRRGQGRALEAPLYRADLPADAGSAELSARQWLQDLHRHRRRPGFRAGLFRSASTASRRSRWSAPPAARSTAMITEGKPILTKDPKLLLNDNDAGKPEGIHLMIGRRPVAAFGNSTGDQQMLEYTGAGDGLRLKMLVLHDDAKREYAYGPAEGLPDTKVGTFSQDLYDEAKKDGWIVISMKNDWKRIFAFEDD